jgi:glucose-6-phosphate isomerase
MPTVSERFARWPELGVGSKRARLNDTYHASAGALTNAWRDRARSAADASVALWRRDPLAWSTDDAERAKIANRLGWLGSLELMADERSRLHASADDIKRAGFTDIVLLGMGGSSLAPEVLRSIIGSAPGFPRLQVLDSTDPAAVRSASTPPERTLYILASKSGTTIEPNSLAGHFRQRLQDSGVARWADHFIAITDEGTALARRARDEGFRDVFINPSDIGGRFSALSYFGLVPAALMGQDVEALIGWGLAMASACEEAAGTADDPGGSLGLAIGAAAAAGRDKLTLILPPSLEPFGLWVEQLIAESTGKQGHGVVPIAGEPLAHASSYGSDRVFVRLRVEGVRDETEGNVHELVESGAPVIDIVLPELAAIGSEFLRWEIATAVAGALLRINPFDEPNVQQAKDATNALLAQYKADGRLPSTTSGKPSSDGITFDLSGAAREKLADAGDVLTLVGPGDYVALLAYLGPDPALFHELAALRLAIRDRTRAATTFGYGPRYLHSTGQLHKGGPNSGVFVMITADPAEDVKIPGEPYSFGTLELAQALGDFASLDRAGRRALHVHLPAADASLIASVAAKLLDHVTPKR